MKRIYLLYGKVGAGKTTFVRNFLNNDIVTSPTFSLCNNYYINDKEIAHFDFYNKTVDYSLIYHALNTCDLIFIEWPELLDWEVLKPFEKEIIKVYL